MAQLLHKNISIILTEYLWYTLGSFADKHYPEDGHHLPYSLEKYIHETGPYDIVLDALNVGYYGNNGEFNPKQVGWYS